MSDHVERLREMVDDLSCFGLDAEGAAALVAGAEALERYDEAKGVLRQIASGQSWNPQRDAEEALARLEGK